MSYTPVYPCGTPYDGSGGCRKHGTWAECEMVVHEERGKERQRVLEVSAAVWAATPKLQEQIAALAEIGSRDPDEVDNP